MAAFRVALAAALFAAFECCDVSFSRNDTHLVCRWAFDGGDRYCAMGLKSYAGSAGSMAADTDLIFAFFNEETPRLWESGMSASGAVPGMAGIVQDWSVESSSATKGASSITGARLLETTDPKDFHLTAAGAGYGSDRVQPSSWNGVPVPDDADAIATIILAEGVASKVAESPPSFSYHAWKTSRAVIISTAAIAVPVGGGDVQTKSVEMEPSVPMEMVGSGDEPTEGDDDGGPPYATATLGTSSCVFRYRIDGGDGASAAGGAWVDEVMIASSDPIVRRLVAKFTWDTASVGWCGVCFRNNGGGTAMKGDGAADCAIATGGPAAASLTVDSGWVDGYTKPSAHTGGVDVWTVVAAAMDGTVAQVTAVRPATLASAPSTVLSLTASDSSLRANMSPPVALPNDASTSTDSSSATTPTPTLAPAAVGSVRHSHEVAVVTPPVLVDMLWAVGSGTSFASMSFHGDANIGRTSGVNLAAAVAVVLVEAEEEECLEPVFPVMVVLLVAFIASIVVKWCGVGVITHTRCGCMATSLPSPFWRIGLDQYAFVGAITVASIGGVVGAYTGCTYETQISTLGGITAVVVTIATLPAFRHNIFSFLTRSSYERNTRVHQILAVLGWALAVVHGGTVLARSDDIFKLSTHRVTGAISLLCMTYNIATSIHGGPRRAFYRVWLIGHISSFVVMGVALLVHGALFTVPLAAACFVYDALVRVGTALGALTGTVESVQVEEGADAAGGGYHPYARLELKLGGIFGSYGGYSAMISGVKGGHFYMLRSGVGPGIPLSVVGGSVFGSVRGSSAPAGSPAKKSLPAGIYDADNGGGAVRAASSSTLGASGTTVVVCCEVVGPSTTTLAALRRGDSLKMDGPFGNPSVDIAQFESVILVGGGVGVTPICGVLAELRSYPHRFEKVKSVIVVWTFRHASIHKLLYDDVVGPGGDEPSIKSIDYQLYYTGTNTTGAVPRGCITGRPPLQKIADDVAISHNNRVRSVGVIVCGPDALMRSVAGACSSSTFALHMESFAL